MALESCGEWWTGSAWVEPTEVHVWDGNAWVQAVEVHAYDGISWVRILPCITEVAFTVSENLLILDTGQAIKTSRNVIKGPYAELLVFSETGQRTAFRVIVSETLNILDTSSVTKISRTVIKGPYAELLVLTETGQRTAFRIIVPETFFILDTGSVSKISRTVLKSYSELLVMTETGVISITDLPPIVDSCSVTEDPFADRARVEFAPGDYCESVRIDKIVDGTPSFHENMNTTPNTTGIFSSYYNGTCPEAVSFEVHPFKANGQSGTEGTLCVDGPVVLGNEGCK